MIATRWIPPVARAARGIVAMLTMLVVAAVVLPGGAAAARAADPGLPSKTFTAHYRTVDEIVALIQPAISERGSYAVQPRIKSVTVTDTAEIIHHVEELIAGFDLPPRAVTLVVQLMRAEEGTPDKQDKPRHMGLPPSVIQDVTKWGVVTPIGGASVTTAENETGSVSLGDDYRVQFQVGAVTQKIGVIRMERFALEKSRKGTDGQSRFSPVMDLVLNLKAGVTTVLGATSSQDSKQALFVSVTATSKEP